MTKMTSNVTAAGGLDWWDSSITSVSGVALALSEKEISKTRMGEWNVFSVCREFYSSGCP